MVPLVPDHGETGGLIETGLSTLHSSGRIQCPKNAKEGFQPRGRRDATHMVSVILNQAAVVDEYELGKGACSRLPADSYTFELGAR